MNTYNIPSCIKVHAVKSKRQTTRQRKLERWTELNYALFSAANKVLGTGKWNHSVTSQTLDYVDEYPDWAFCGCTSFVRIQLKDGTFHEDIGYHHGEGITKGSAIQLARIGSVTNAFERALNCFGETAERAVIQVKCSYKDDTNDANENSKDLESQYLNDVRTQDFEPRAQSTPYITSNRTEKTTQTEIKTSSKSPSIPNNANQEKKESNEINNLQEDQEIAFNEDFLRLERKRRQMEKQAEFKRLLKEKELQKATENKKPNPKY